MTRKDMALNANRAEKLINRIEELEDDFKFWRLVGEREKQETAEQMLGLAYSVLMKEVCDNGLISLRKEPEGVVIRIAKKIPQPKNIDWGTK